MRMITLRPRMYDLNHFSACTTAKASRFVVEYMVSVFERTLLMYAKGRSSPFTTLDSTAPRLLSLASVSMTKGWLKSGKLSVGSFKRRSFSSLKAAVCSGSHVNFNPFLVSSCRGLAISANPLMNLR